MSTASVPVPPAPTASGQTARRLRHAGQRLATVLLTLLGLLFLTFVIGRVMPLDPVLSIVGPDADRSTYEQVRQQLGLDRPLAVQFGYYLRDLSHGDLGKALLTGHPVRDDLARVLPATVELATLAILIGTLVGVPLGVYAATRRGRLGDHVVRLISLFGHSTPIFWFGMMGLLVFYAWLGWAGAVAASTSPTTASSSPAPACCWSTRPWPASGRCSRAPSASSRCPPASSGCTRSRTSAA